MMVAMARAAHLVLDEDPKIFQDSLALRLSGMESEAALLTALEAIQTELARRSTSEIAQKLSCYGRAGVAMRQRYTEEELDKAVERGVGQYVMLGAGLDSFAYRRPDLAPTLTHLRGGPSRHTTMETRPLAGVERHPPQQSHLRALGF